MDEVYTAGHLGKGAEGTIAQPLRSWIWPGEVGRTEGEISLRVWIQRFLGFGYVMVVLWLCYCLVRKLSTSARDPTGQGRKLILLGAKPSRIIVWKSALQGQADCAELRDCPGEKLRYSQASPGQSEFMLLSVHPRTGGAS